MNIPYQFSYEIKSPNYVICLKTAGFPFTNMD